MDIPSIIVPRVHPMDKCSIIWTPRVVLLAAYGGVFVAGPWVWGHDLRQLPARPVGHRRLCDPPAGGGGDHVRAAQRRLNKRLYTKLPEYMHECTLGRWKP